MSTGTTYPKLGAAAWRTVRARAAAAPSTKFTPTTVATLLDYDSSKSAANNVVSPLQKMGLIDDSGTLTARGNKWRNDATYAEACQEILDEVYPADLAAFKTPGGDPDKALVEKWFLHQSLGEANASKSAATYVLVAEMKVPEAADTKDAKPKAASRQQATGAARASRAASKPVSEGAVTQAAPPPQAAQPLARPDIHLDFQIHIAADSSPDLIDQIFASMAKHLYPAT